jgi:hypothetical protein
MSLAMIDRRNQSIVKSVPFPDEHNPHLLPPLATTVWHYVRFDYFQALMKNGAMWFTRIDKQSDKMDGTYSEANASQMTPASKNLIDSLGIVEGPKWAQLLQTNDILRKKAYVHCWSIRPHESAWMWNAFLQGTVRSVAIRSTIGHLGAALSGQQVDFLRVIYYPPGIPRPDWSYTAPFSAKDKIKHREERELRLMSVTEIGAADEGEYKLIPTDTKPLIGKIVVHPLSPPEFQKEVRSELRRYSIGVHVARSELRAHDLQAVARSQ